MVMQLRALRGGAGVYRPFVAQQIAPHQVQLQSQFRPVRNSRLSGLFNVLRSASTYVRPESNSSTTFPRSSGDRGRSDRKSFEKSPRGDFEKDRRTDGRFSKNSFKDDTRKRTSSWGRTPEDSPRGYGRKEESAKPRYGSKGESPKAEWEHRRSDKPSFPDRRPRRDGARESVSYGPGRIQDRDTLSTEPGNPVESSLDKRLRIYPGTSPYDASVHLNNFIRNGRNPKGHVRNNTDNSSYLDTAEEIVKTAPKESINIAVWNVLLSGFAKERKYQRMFKLFNDMKKRGIRPSSRTYAIMLNNYPSSHDAPEKTLSRATLLYDEAQRHIQQVLSQIAEAKETEGYELSSDRPSSKAASGLPQLDIEAEAAEEMEGLKLDAYTSGNAVAPTNAYLGLLCHFAQFEEMKRVYDAMPKEGPMAPDGKTYTILFEGNIAYNRVGTERGKSARNSASVRTGTRSQDVAKKDKEILFDSQQIWNEIMSREEKITRKAKKQAQQNQRSGARLMDEQESSIIDDRLVVTALRAFMAGTLEDQSYALNEIVPTVYGLSSPGRASSAFAKTTNSSLAVHIDVTERAVETILKLCLATDRPQEGAHYAHQFLNMPKVFVSQLGLTHYNAMLAMFSKLNDAGQCLQLLDTKPDFLQGRGWPRSSWIYALKAAKFAGDWDNFKIAFTRMSRMLPTGTPDAEATKTSIEKGIPVDDQMSSLLLATAASTNRISVVRDALRTFAYCYADRPVATTTDDTDAEYWRRQLVDNAERCMSKVEAAGRDAESGRDVAEEKSWSDLVASLRLARVESKNAPQSGSSNQDDSNPRVRRESPRSSPRQRSDQWRPSNSRRA